MPFIFPYKVDATSGVSKWNLNEGEILLKDDLSTLTDPAGSMLSMNGLLLTYQGVVVLVNKSFLFMILLDLRLFFLMTLNQKNVLDWLN